MAPRASSSRQRCWTASVVAGFGGAEEVVVGDSHALPRGPESWRRPGWRTAVVGFRRPLRSACTFWPLLVGAGEEEGVFAQQAVTARDDIGGDGGVGVADVGTGG